MKKLVMICIFLSGLLHAYTGFASGVTVPKDNPNYEFTINTGLPVSDPDIVHLVQLNHFHQTIRQVNADVFATGDHYFRNSIQQLVMCTHALDVIFYDEYLDHIYPSHNFW